MVYIPHENIKPEKIAATYVGLIERRLVIPQLFNRQGIEDFVGSEGDAVSIKVPGRLPARRYAFRNDRSAPIKLDVYKERKITTTFGDLIYSGSPITDEQKDFDGISPTSLLQPQSRAVAAELEQVCIEKLTSNIYEVQIGGVRGKAKRALLEARRVFNALRAPEGQRFMLVGSEFELELLLDEKLGIGNTAGDQQGVDASAFSGASIGSRYGITFVRSDEIDPEAAYLLTGNAFNLLTGAPSVPEGATFGATTSYNGLALRWLKDYDFMYRYDRSTVDTYVGTSHTTDVFLQFDKSTLPGDTTHVGEVVGTQDHFVRGIKLHLDEASSGPAVNSAFALDTGIAGATLWDGANATSTGPVPVDPTP